MPRRRAARDDADAARRVVEKVMAESAESFVDAVVWAQAWMDAERDEQDFLELDPRRRAEVAGVMAGILSERAPLALITALDSVRIEITPRPQLLKPDW